MEHTRPAKLQRMPKINTEMSAHFSKNFNFFHLSFKWKREGRRKVIAAPVILPVKPISRAKWGTNMAISRVSKRMELLKITANNVNLELDFQFLWDTQAYKISVTAKKGNG